MNKIVSVPAILFLLFSVFQQYAAAENTVQNKPNIIVVIADDLGRQCVSYLGGPVFTPNIDELAGKSIQLDRFYTDAACAPTRAAFLTGKYAVRLGLEAGMIRPVTEIGLPRDEVLLPEILRDNGYSTYLVGKWHLGHAQKWMLPMQRGFDSHYGHYCDLILYRKKERFGIKDWNLDGSPIEEKGHSTNLIARKAVQIIRNHPEDRPFYLQIAFNASHGPFAPKKKFLKMYSEYENKQFKNFAATTTDMDQQFSRIVRAVNESGRKDNTLILFFSDNGANNTIREQTKQKLRGHKATYFEGGVRTPSFIYWPSKTETGFIYRHPVHITDLFPTILSIAGANGDQYEGIDGVDQSEFIADNSPPQPRIMFLGMNNSGAGLIDWPYKVLYSGIPVKKQVQILLRQFRMFEFSAAADSIKKIIRTAAHHFISGRSFSEYMFFNLEQDPYETHDLSRQNTGEYSRIKEQLKRFMNLSRGAASWFSPNHPKSPLWKPPKYIGE